MDRAHAPARWWLPIDGARVHCELCPVGCTLDEGRDGPCGTRGNRGGEMVPLHYGEIVSAGMDPIEKKPLYHFHPGRDILSVAAPGCNLHCAFCQNWRISQPQAVGGAQRTTATASIELAQIAERENAVGIAYTYSEPLVWYEFVRDTSEVFRARGLKNVVVTNGFLNPEPLGELLGCIDAANVDLKAMDDGFYRRVCKGRLEPVLATIRTLVEAGIHVEITNLLIPGYNDAPEQIRALVEFVASFGREIPLHFSAYHPSWKLDAPATPLATLLMAREHALQKLDWVYLGNVTGSDGRDTRCPSCGQIAIARTGRTSTITFGPGGSCSACGKILPIRLD